MERSSGILLPIFSLPGRYGIAISESVPCAVVRQMHALPHRSRSAGRPASSGAGLGSDGAEQQGDRLGLCHASGEGAEDGEVSGLHDRDLCLRPGDGRFLLSSFPASGQAQG